MRAAHRPVLAGLLVAAAMAGPPAPAHAQSSAADVGVGDPPEAAARADSVLDRAGRADEALAVLEAALAERPGSYPLLWRAARSATALSVLQEGRPARRDSLLNRAIALGERAVAADPGGLDGRYWRVAAKGRLSLYASDRAAAALAGEIEEEALAILEADSLHAGAHNALGRLNLEVMVLPGWKRALGRVLSSELGAMSWERAERHLQRALELEPGNALYLRDLGALHFHRGRGTAARILLTRLVERTGLAPWDRVFQDEARELLEKLEAG